MSVAPMLLLPFVENAFKHGVDDTKPGIIVLKFEQTNDGIQLLVKNGIMNVDNGNEHNIAGKGIGVANTQRRLNLLYPGKHLLNINVNRAQKDYQLKLTFVLI